MLAAFLLREPWLWHTQQQPGLSIATQVSPSQLCIVISEPFYGNLTLLPIAWLRWLSGTMEQAFAAQLLFQFLCLENKYHGGFVTSLRYTVFTVVLSVNLGSGIRESIFLSSCFQALQREETISVQAFFTSYPLLREFAFSQVRALDGVLCSGHLFCCPSTEQDMDCNGIDLFNSWRYFVCTLLFFTLDVTMPLTLPHYIALIFLLYVSQFIWIRAKISSHSIAWIIFVLEIP